ncbi:MAG: DNA repair ATPase [Polyangiales bacterium]
MTDAPRAPTAAAEELGGSYEVIRRRLVEQAEELGRRADSLNARRKEVFGGAELALVATDRLRTENNCLPRDIVSVGPRMLVGYDVFVGMKAEVAVPDVFALHRVVRGEGGAVAFEPLPIEDGGFLADERFTREFAEQFRYVRETRLQQLRRTDTRLLAVFTTGTGPRDLKVFRWGIDAAGRVTYMDARGEEDHARPRAHDFTWKTAGREQQVQGKHPHVSIYDEVFVETVGGDLTIKVENNTATGHGIYAEPVDDANQSLDDAQILYARLGPLILLRIKPYRETAWRHFLYNPRRRQVLRVDAIEQACLALPEEQGVVFATGYYLVTGEHKLFDAEGAPSVFERVIRSPNGEDVLYVFFREGDGRYVLHPYNLIRKEVAAPITCHGYSLFEDGTLVVFRAAPGEEPRRVHPMQVWRTPFVSAEVAASAPVTGSFLGKVGNPELVRGIAEALSLVRLATAERPDRQTWEDLIAATGHMADAFHWLGHAECFDLLSVVKQLRVVGEQIVDEYEKAEAIRRRAAEALAAAESAQADLLRPRPDDARTAAEFMAALTALRRQRGALGALREMRAIDLARVESLEDAVDARFGETSLAAAQFLSGDDALKPLLDAIAAAVAKAEKVARSVDLAPVRAELDQVYEGLTVLSETVAGLKVDDPTVRTRILDAIGEVFGQLNRGRAIAQARAKEIGAGEGRAEYAAQAKLFAQAVQSALAVADSPERCDASLARLTVQLEELEGRFGELDEFAADLAARREELTDAFGAKRQTLLDERQRRAANLLAAAERILQGVARRVKTLANAEELHAYFAGDPLVARARELVEQLRALGDTVKADEVEGRLKAARQEGTRALRDRAELFDDDPNVIKLGRHRFFVNAQPLELAILPRDGGLAAHLTGTDFFDPLEDPALADARDLWEQALPSESDDVYRGEFLAASMLRDAERGERGLSLARLRETAVDPAALLATVRAYAAERHDEGYERGVHDVDAAAILARVVALLQTAGTLRHDGAARALGLLHASALDENARSLLARRARSAGRLLALRGAPAARAELAAEVTRSLDTTVARWGLTADVPLRARAARYLVDELAADRPRFVLSGEAQALREAFWKQLQEDGARGPFEDDLRALEAHPAERLALATRWLEAFAAGTTHAVAVAECAASLVADRRLEREPAAAVLEAKVEGLLGRHPRIAERAMTLRLDAFLARTDAFLDERVPRWRAWRKARAEVAERERRRLRLDEFSPKVLTSFVRNRLIDEVYLPLVGANLARQLGAAGEGKRTDLMGLLLLVSPPGYGKTTLMEYVASRLGLVFVKVNGPSLGHAVVSLDPAEAPNATARQEVEKINLAFEMGNNVMLYLDDIQHTNPELLQKFISLCDGSRRVEGVWRGRTRTYDLRGKRFCIAMAGNPYTESGARFRVPDMLANRADTYNLGEILGGRDDVFALSYLENALTSNATLAPLAGRDPGDVHKLVRMAQGGEVPASSLAHPYSAAEISEFTAVLKSLLQVQRTLLAVNAEYIKSASQEDAFRTEPPFKLQGSYRNMNKVAEKVVAAHTPDEIESLLDDHYAGESQTLTTGAEQNLLKLAEIRGRMTDAQRARWEAIKKEYARQKRVGGRDDDPVARVTGTLSTLGEELERIRVEIGKAAASAAKYEGDAGVLKRIGPQLDGLQRALAAVARPTVEVKLPGPDATAEAVAAKLRAVGAELAPLARATQHGLGTLPGLLESLVQVLTRVEQRLASGQALAVAAMPVAAAAAGVPARPTPVPPPPTAPRGLAPLPDALGTMDGARGHFAVDLGADTPSRLYVPKGAGLDPLRDGGVFVQTHARLPAIGSTVTLDLTVRGQGRFEVEAVVTFAREAALDGPDPGFGARLPRIAPALDHALRTLLLERDAEVLKGR